MKDLYYNYNAYLQKRFGCRVYKIAVDAGFTCPNRDGTKGVNGCIFCDERGSSALVHPLNTSIKDQILKNIDFRQKKFKSKKFIIYFQSFTNTYAPPDILKKIYDEALFAHPDICGISIATRGDSVDQEKLELIASYKKKFPFVSIEYGLQTIHDKTLIAINRCETHQDFLNAYNLTSKLNIDIITHVILGLPNESREEILQTADFIASHKIQGVKIHLLVALKGTRLAEKFIKKEWHPLSFVEYVQLTADFLERLPPHVPILRLSGNGHPFQNIAPHWIIDYRKEVREAIQNELKKRGSWQGKFCKYFLRETSAHRLKG